MTSLLFVSIAIAGGVGAALRFVVDGVVQRSLPTSLPVGTGVVNVTGSLALGLVTGFALVGAVGEDWRPVIAVGLLGGYTTFSTASLETVRLVQRGDLGRGVVSGVGMLVLSVLAAWAGLAIATTLAAG